MLRTLHHPQGVAALTGLPDAIAADLMKVMNLKTFRKGSVLFAQGEEPHAVFFLESGRVKWHKVSEDGNEQILQVVERGQAVGLVALLDRKPFVAGATAVEDTVVWAMTVADFDRMVMRHPQLALLVMNLLGDGVRWLLEHVHAMTNRSAHERVASALIRKAEPSRDGSRVIPLTHQEIAHLAGMARETVSRVLSDFQRRGAVRLNRNAVVLLDAKLFWAPQQRVKSG
ncbi:MAG TPA: Crp/Fnr family transcriptional regulator [Symbiobacteriaceae bacterium]|nr:Crp/Fnr family transcriptional regulator [Symbiobacteriaceae bacterium]